MAHCLYMSKGNEPKRESVEPLELTGDEGKKVRKPAVRRKPSFRKPPVEADQRTLEPERPEDLVPEGHWVRGLVRLVEAFAPCIGVEPEKSPEEKK